MPGLIRGVARTAAVVGTATAVSGRVRRRQEGRWAAQDQPAAPAPAPVPTPAPVQYAEQPPAPQYAEQPPAPAGPSSMEDKLAQLQQLGQLRDAGVLTEAEFEAQKGKILNS